MDTENYQKVRKAVLERDLHTCQLCGEKGELDYVHRIKSKRDAPELAFEMKNLVTLCASCQNGTANVREEGKWICDPDIANELQKIVDRKYLKC